MKDDEIEAPRSLGGCLIATAFLILIAVSAVAFYISALRFDP